MKNMKVSMKLIVSFVIVIALSIVVGGVGILGMYQINAADDAMYQTNYLPTVKAGDISQMVVEQRVHIRNFVIYDVNTDAETFAAAEESLLTSKQEMEQLLDEYEPTIVNPEDRAAFDKFVAVYEGQWLPIINHIQELGNANQTEEAKAALVDAGSIATNLDELTSQLQQINLADGQAAVNANTELFTTMTIIEASALVLAIAAAMFLALYISGLISKPLKDMMGYIKQAGETGNLHFRDEEWANCDKLSLGKDEIGQTMKAFTQMMRKFVYYGEAVSTVARNDLTVHVDTLGDHDTFGNAIESMVQSLNNMFADINNASNQVSTGSVQIADGAQLLAQGATEQSATVEELSASIAEVNDQTKANASLADDAKKLGEDIKANAERGNNQMGQMIKAVGEISDASTAIGKVIKIIDDIAFQTNILALNAAVEAARAGQHGKGFAVVADEVRSLAAKSAEAAKNTSELIATSIEKSEQGAAISKETAESLEHIVSGIIHSSELVAKIAQSSSEQSISIGQIGEAIEQVSQVIQQNSATAEESAAASEQMSGQATMLQQLISQFKLKEHRTDYTASASHNKSNASKDTTVFSLDFIGAEHTYGQANEKY